MSYLENSTNIPSSVHHAVFKTSGSETTRSPHNDMSIIMTKERWWIPHFEIPFLIIVILIGIIGNITIIGAIVMEKKLKFVGNAFIVNLAVADLIVTSYVLPGVLANVITNENLFSPQLCSFTAIILSVSCVTSMYTLMFVSFNRYVAIVHNSKYPTLFAKKNVAVMIAGIWTWSFVLTLPPALGWGAYRYHHKIHVCMYDCDTDYVCVAIIVPFLITCFCYCSVLRSFNESREKYKSIKRNSGVTISSISTTTKITRKTTQRENSERRLVITLFAAVFLFTICWLPYALIILVDHQAPAFYKRSTAWLAFTNSAMNSILYGVLNRNFRKGYRKMWKPVLKCCVCYNDTSMRNKDNSIAYSTKTDMAMGREELEIYKTSIDVNSLTRNTTTNI